MNNLTKAYQENTGFRTVVSTVAVWMNVAPDDEPTSGWLLKEWARTNNGVCSLLHLGQCEDVNEMMAELHRVQAENYELKQKIVKLKEVLR